MTRILDDWLASSYAESKDTGRLPRGRNPLKSYILEANALEGQRATGWR